MIGAFNSVYTALQGFLSRSFWFSAFLPVALFALLHAIIAGLVIGPVTVLGVPLSLEKEISLTALATAGPAIIVGLVIIGYGLLPLLPRFRGLLDGSLLPTALHDWLRKARQKEARKTLDLINASFAEAGALRTMSDDAYRDAGALLTAYRTATALSGAPNAALLDAADKELNELRNAISAWDKMTSVAEIAEIAVLEALKRNNPDAAELAARRTAAGRVTTPAEAEAEAALAARTNKVTERLEELLSEAAREAVYQHQILKARIRVAGALENPRATLVGDARFVVERYAYDVYRVDFNFLWPRLLVAMKAEKADDPMLEDIENARVKVDFAVLSLVLAASIPMVWLPALLILGGSAWLFLLIGAATPPVLWFFYELVFEGQLAFGDLVKTAIDKSRFLVLRMLRQPDPVSRSEERLLWTRIARAEEDARIADLVYVTKNPGAGP